MNNPISDDVLREILRGCEGVTPGPWYWSPGDDYYIHAPAYPSAYPHRDKADDLGGMLAEIGNRPSDYGQANAAHIASLDPATVSSIITELLALREAVTPIAKLVTEIETAFFFANSAYSVVLPDEYEIGVIFDEEGNATVTFKMGDLRALSRAITPPTKDTNHD